MSDTFHREFNPHHGGSLRAGDVIRVLPDGCAFGDAVILGFNEDGDAKVSRPYSYASCVGTTCANDLLGSEVYVLTRKNVEHLISKHPVLDHGRTT